MLTYTDLAKRLGIPKGTLVRQIAENNRRAGQEGGDKIMPDEERPTGATQHFFRPERVEEIKKILAAPKARGRGRPRKKKEPK